VTIAQADISDINQLWGPKYFAIGLVRRAITVNTTEYTSVAVLTPVIPKPKLAGNSSEIAFAI
jgi:hypothetical protein